MMQRSSTRLASRYWLGAAALGAMLAASVFPLRASGNLSFVTHTIDTGLTGGYQVVVTDLNRDGLPDIIALATRLPDLVWYENPTWDKHVITSDLQRPINLAAHDVDDDGHPGAGAGSPGLPRHTPRAEASCWCCRTTATRGSGGHRVRSTACRRPIGSAGPISRGPVRRCWSTRRWLGPRRHDRSFSTRCRWPGTDPTTGADVR